MGRFTLSYEYLSVSYCAARAEFVRIDSCIRFIVKIIYLPEDQPTTINRLRNLYLSNLYQVNNLSVLYKNIKNLEDSSDLFNLNT